MRRGARLALLAMSLAACTERDQTLAAADGKPDGKAWQATATPYTVKGWSSGDQRSWETQLRARAQTQNEYAKIE